MGRIFLVLGGALALAACGSGRPAGAPNEGLVGIVYVSPATPVCRSGNTCSRPARGFRLVLVGNGGRLTTTTDRNGRYRIRLERGRYAVRPGRTLKRSLQPARVTVPRGRFAKRDFTYDSGIR